MTLRLAGSQSCRHMRGQGLMRSRFKTIGVTAAVTTAVVAYLARRRSPVISQADPAPAAQNVNFRSESEPGSNPENPSRNAQSTRAGYRFSPYLIAVSIPFAAVALLAAHLGYALAASASALVAMTFSFSMSFRRGGSGRRKKSPSRQWWPSSWNSIFLR